MQLNTPRVLPDAAIFEAIACYFCGSNSHQPFVLAQDDLTGKPGTFSFVRCDECGLVYQNPRVGIAHIKDYYDEEYIAHRKKQDWGALTWFYNYAMGKHDREKDRIVRRYIELGAESQVLDVGCGAATFLLRTKERYGSRVTGVDFKDLSQLPNFDQIDFHCGLFYEQDFRGQRFDLLTMWHFLEHDYAPMRTLSVARELLTQDGRLIIEVPRLDSVSYRLFHNRWAGLQAPQHTVLYDREMLLKFVEKAGLELVDYLPYGAFPAYFYLFAGVAFRIRQGKGLDFSKAIYPYFAGQLLLSPLLLFERHLNLAMQTVVCKRAT
ncbi:MAG: class I SAM-dependent methyltransferase [Pirellulaceae bacterium]